MDHDSSTTSSLPTAFPDRLRQRLELCPSPLCLGIDPRPARLPDDCFPSGSRQGASRDEIAVAVLRFGRALIESAGPFVAGVKPQIAFFECLGPAGFEVYWQLCEDARAAGLLVVADVKRGDIGSTAEAYAQAYLAPSRCPEPVADAVTLNPYLGRDSLDPFCRAAVKGGGGLFVLVKTSNPSAVEIQELQANGRPIHSYVAELVEELNQSYAPGSAYGPVGAVVGATWPSDLKRARETMPHAILLVPGVGAQGAGIDDVLSAFDDQGFGALIAVSRSLNYPWGSNPAPSDWRDLIQKSARELSEALRRGIEAHVG